MDERLGFEGSCFSGLIALDSGIAEMGCRVIIGQRDVFRFSTKICVYRISFLEER